MEVPGSSAIRRRQFRRYALYGAAAVLAGALAYKACRSDAVAQTRQSLARLRAALTKYSVALSSGADLCCTLVRDLQSFLQSDTGEVPPSLRQLARLLQSPEVTQTTAKTVAAVYRGFAGGGSASSAADGGDSSGQDAVDKVLAALLSDRGHSLVSVAVSLGARNLVGGLVEGMARVQEQQRGGGPPPPGAVDKILDFCATQRGQQLAVAAITAFVTNGVRVYMDSTLDINFYEDIFSSMARPAHLEAVKQCVGMFAREAVGTAMQGGSPQRPEQRRGSRAALIRELSPSPSASPVSTPMHAQQQQQQQQQQECSDFRAGSPSDSAFRSSQDGASPPASVSAGPLNGGAAGALLPPRLERRQLSGELTDGAADDLDSDSLLHARREQGAKQGQQQQGGGGLTWLPAVTKEVLAVVKDPNARSVLVGAAGATAHEFGAAMVAGLGQLEVTRRWGTRGLVALLLLTFLSLCLVQELLRAAVLAVLR